MTKIAGSGSISQRHGSADPDPHQNVTDPEHRFEESILNSFNFLTRINLLAFFLCFAVSCSRTFSQGFRGSGSHFWFRKEFRKMFDSWLKQNMNKKVIN
jgi:hypothetical protein